MRSNFNTEGLDHYECLKRLHDKTENILSQFKNEKLKARILIRSFLLKNRYEFIHNCLPIILCIVGFIAPFESKNSNFDLNLILLFMISVFNLALLLLFYFKTVAVIHQKARRLLQIIKNICESKNECWFNDDFLSSDIPLSQSVSNQLVYRNSKLVNLPLNLVVEGDLILVKPGQLINLKCKPINDNKDESSETFETGKIYEPNSDRLNEKIFSNDKFKNSHLDAFEITKIPDCIFCEALETPYLKYLKLTLNNFNCDSNSILTNEIKKVRKIFLFAVIPFVLIAQIVISILQMILFEQKFSITKFNEVFFQSLINLLIPLLPISFTFFWKTISLYGTVCLLKLERCLKKLRNRCEQNTDQEKTKKSKREKSYLKDRVNINQENFNLLSSQNLDELDASLHEIPSIESLLDDLEQEERENLDLKRTGALEKLAKNYKFYLNVLKKIIFFDKKEKFEKDQCFHNASFIYHSNFLMGLGITTNFSCIDKKGVLAWPIPTAEKIWLINDIVDNKCGKNESKASNKNLNEIESEQIDGKKNSTCVEKKVIETFNITHDCTNGFQLKFDDKNWNNSLNSLKPLGLSILLNTCNEQVTDNYFKLCDFIRAQSTQINSFLNEKSHQCISNAENNDHSLSSSFDMYEEQFEVKAVMDRHCLCEISNIIGFDRHTATNFYRLIGTNYVCRNLKIKPSCKFRPKQIFLSNIFSVIASNELNGVSSIYSQGSPDLILDFCTDYWNGRSICQMNKLQRKKLLELYQRFSVSSHCTAFSYKPLIDCQNIDEIKLSQNFVLECPSTFCEQFSNLEPIFHKTESENEIETLAASFDDIFENIAINNSKSCLNVHDKDESEITLKKNILDLHTEQIFLGMVSMQYKARIDVVKLVEVLTNSCIRFVHFSYDNENISKAFAEMLGLDTGWNCHISLANDTNTTNISKNVNYDSFNDQNSILNDNLDHRKRILKNTSQDSKVKKVNKRLWAKRKLTSDRKLSHGYSLPNLRFTSYSQANTSSHCVKFNLKNSFKNRRRSKKLTHLGSIDRSSISSGNSFVTISENYKMNHLNKTSNIKSNLNTYTASASSVKSSTIIKENGRSSKRKSPPVPKFDDDSSIHSGRSLSETEIYGNAAQLPRGIDNIRRHLDSNIDNVPLHVSLFTDSNKNSIIQMILIMKDYGEIVCCLGSSHSIENNYVFSVANVAISIEPVYPKLCINSGFDQPAAINSTEPKKPELMDLCESMNSLCCGINLKHDELFLLPPIMSLAREMVYSYRVAMLFMIKSNLSVSLLQLLCNLLFLPPILSELQVTLLVIFTIPFLSYSLVHKNESNELRCNTKKNTSLINTKDIQRFLSTFLIKFCPSIILLIIFFSASLFFKFNEIKIIEINHTSVNSTMASDFFSKNILSIKRKNGTSLNDAEKNLVKSAQILNYLFLTYFLCFISMNFVSVEKSIWKYIPFKNKTWTKILIFILFVNSLIIGLNYIRNDQLSAYVKALPVQIWILVVFWPIVLIIINEIYKVFEIREIIRQYKKSKLDFDTKLGMNSPFV